MAETVSIYDYIKEHMTEEGTLEEGVTINQVFGHGKMLPVVDGFKDGTMIFSLGIEEADVIPLCYVIDQVCQGNTEEAEKILAEFFSPENSDVTALCCIDDVQNWAEQFPDALKSENLIHFVYHLLRDSANVEAVKFGLSLAEIMTFDEPEKILELIRTLALSDEFTAFCVFVVREWDNGNTLIFDMAKKVHGWGRISAVYWLHPETEEIKKWLLHEGCDNDIDGKYNALGTAYKVNLADIMESPDLTEQDYWDAVYILNLLLDDEPEWGISEYEERNRLLHAATTVVEKRAAEKKAELDDCRLIYRIWSYLSREEESEEKDKERCLAMLQSSWCRRVVEQAMEEGDGYDMGNRLQMDVSIPAIRGMQKHPESAIDLLPYALTDDRETNRKVLGFMESILPLKEIREESDQRFEEGPLLEQKYVDLSMVLQVIRHCPGAGENILLTGMMSAGPQNRNMALRALESWKEKEGRLSPKMIEALHKMKERENQEDIKEDIEELLKE
jgi:hypothetical protein